MRWIMVVIIASSMMLTGAVYASEGIISPIPDPDITPVVQPLRTPRVTFNELLAAVPDFPMILGDATRAATITPTPTPTSTPAPTTEPAVGSPRTARKRDITVTLLGDSMIDTLGPVGSGLSMRLNAVYPNATFTIINHGVGAENIDSGLKRLTNSYSYLGLGRNSVVAEKPDIVVVESFGYNPYPLPDINDALTTHWLRLAAIVDTLRRELPESRIVIAVTIAPNWDVFGDGAPGLSFSPEGKRTKVEEIKKYLESTIAFAKSQGIPLADVYTPSLDSTGNGKLAFINAGDHIHYSDSGRALFSQTVANTIIANRLLE